MENIDLTNHIKITPQGTIILDIVAIQTLLNWWNLEGTYTVFCKYEMAKLKKYILTEEEIFFKMVNTIIGKGAEFALCAILGAPLMSNSMLKTDVLGDGGVDIRHNEKNYDVKSRRNKNSGFSIRKDLFETDINFSVFTLINSFNNKNFFKLEYFEYEYNGTMHSSELRILRDTTDRILRHEDPEFWMIPSKTFNLEYAF